MSRGALSAGGFAWLALALTSTAAPLDFLKATDPAALQDAARELPAPVRPAVEFQKVFLRIRADDPVTGWRAVMAKFATATGDEPMTVALRELARCWEARARMTEIDRALRKYYRTAIRFPDHLTAVERDMPEAIRLDPWGEPWVYAPTAPRGFSPKFARQRYQLGPTRWPQLSTVAEALAAKPAAPSWKIIRRAAGGAPALELRSAEGQVAVLQAGGRFAGAVLAHLGEGWALFTDTERLFAVAF